VFDDERVTKGDAPAGAVGPATAAPAWRGRTVLYPRRLAGDANRAAQGDVDGSCQLGTTTS